MNIINLPDVLIGTNVPNKNDVIFYYHIGHDSNYTSKITFKTHCISLLLTGKKHVYIGEQNFFYDNTHCLLFKSGNYLSTEISPDRKPYHSLLIFFNSSAFDRFKHKYYNLISVLDVADGNYKKYISVPTDAYIENFKISAKQKLMLDSFTPELQKLKFEEIMLHLLEQNGKEVIDFFETTIHNESTSFFRKVVEEHVYSNISVQELAFLCHMSKSTFKRAFSEIYGDTPGKWLREKRLDCSAYHIGALKKSPSQVCEELGFTSFSSFIQSFKRKFGTTPKQYQLNYN